MNNFFSLALILAMVPVIILNPSYSYAEGRQDNPIYIFSECNAIIAKQDAHLSPQQIISAITSWEIIGNRSFGPRAAFCMTALTNHLWLFDADNGVVIEASEQENADWILQNQQNAENEEVLALQQSSERCALLKVVEANNEIVTRFEGELEERRLLAQDEALMACQTWYLDNKVEALTNSVCHGYLTEFGVPIRDGDVRLEEFEAANQLGAEASAKLDMQLFGELNSRDAVALGSALIANIRSAFSVMDECE